MAYVLIVEDDPSMARMYQKTLQLDQFEVDIAGNGEEALSKIKEKKPDVILLDVMMPGMNGFQLLDALKADAATKSIPVMMLTNLAGDADKEFALEKGADKYVIKSQCDPADVRTMVKELLSTVKA